MIMWWCSLHDKNYGWKVDWVVIILLFLGQHLIQHCVIIQRDEKGYGLTVTGDNPVYVQSVKEGLHNVYSFFCEERDFFTHTHKTIKQKALKEDHEFPIKKLLDHQENVLFTLAVNLHLFSLGFCWKLGIGLSVRASCKKFVHFYESSQIRSFLTVNLPDAKSSSIWVVPTVSLLFTCLVHCKLVKFFISILHTHLLLLDCLNYPTETENQPTCRLKHLNLNLIFTCNLYWITQVTV